MISGWVRAPCLSPESFDVTHQVQQFQGQWMAINPKDVFTICIYIYERKGFPVYTRRYHSIPIMMSFHLSYIPLIGSTISIPNGWPSLRTPGLAPRRFSLTRSKSEGCLVSPFRLRSVIKTMVNGWKIVKGIVTRHEAVLSKQF